MKEVISEGLRFGKLTTIEVEYVNDIKKWKCLCDCGNIVYETAGQLKRRKSCGCAKKESRLNRRTGITMYCRVCPVCNSTFESKYKTQKSCSYECGQLFKYVNNPNLKDELSSNGKKQFENMHKNGKSYKMPKGKYTQEFKDALSERAKKPKSAKTKNKMKENHWTLKDTTKEETIAKILHTRSLNPICSTEEYKNRLANYVKENPDCVKSHKRFKVGNYFNKYIEDNEYHHYGYELRFMKFLDKQENVIFWTKRHKIFIKYEFNGVVHEYWPDFLINLVDGIILLIELKGYEEDVDKLNAKIIAGENYCNQNKYTYKIIFQKDKNGFKNFANLSH